MRRQPSLGTGKARPRTPRSRLVYSSRGMPSRPLAWPRRSADGLAVATLVNARDHGLPLPAAAFVMSPYADLTLARASLETKREADPLLSRFTGL
jgi:hypothetical protein